MIEQVRTFIGYREYPKYGMVSRYFVYEEALLEEAERLVRTHVRRATDDIFHLTFQERPGRSAHAARGRPSRRTAPGRIRVVSGAHAPRVLTLEGEAVAGSYRRDDVPAGVGVERATTLIRDGQRIRVHGTEGYVEILA